MRHDPGWVLVNMNEAEEGMSPVIDSRVLCVRVCVHCTMVICEAHFGPDRGGGSLTGDVTDDGQMRNARPVSRGSYYTTQYHRTPAMRLPADRTETVSQEQGVL